MARGLWEEDRKKDLAGVCLPGALARQYRAAAKEFPWFWLFPAREVSRDPESGLRRRHHVLASVRGKEF